MVMKRHIAPACPYCASSRITVYFTTSAQIHTIDYADIKNHEYRVDVYEEDEPSFPNINSRCYCWEGCGKEFTVLDMIPEEDRP